MKKFTFTAEVIENWYLEVEAETLEEAEKKAKEADGLDWDNPNNEIFGGTFSIRNDLTIEH